MTARKSRLIKFFMALMIVVLLAVYAYNKYTTQKIENFAKKSVILERELKKNENSKAQLSILLQQAGSKGFIEKKARLDGFILPDEECFSFINPDMLNQSEVKIEELIIPNN